MARLPYVDPDLAAEQVRTALDRLPGIGIFRMVAHAETCLRPFLRLGNSILGRLELSPRARELAILRVARLSRAEYEWIQHVPFALEAGILQEEIDALDAGDIDAPTFSETDRAVLRFTTEAVERVRVSDETFRRTAALLPPREVVELLLTIGFYRMVATLLETTGVDLEPSPGARFVETASGGGRETRRAT